MRTKLVPTVLPAALALTLLGAPALGQKIAAAVVAPESSEAPSAPAPQSSEGPSAPAPQSSEAPSAPARQSSAAPKAPAPQFSAEPADKPAKDAQQFRTLDEDVQNLKKLAVDLNRDLFLLEEELLFPANTQVAVFVSMDVGAFFGLDSIQVKLDGKDVTNYLYTEREVDALVRGGVQRLYVGNVKAGDHELVAVFTGHGPHDRDYRRGASLKFQKGIGPKYIELTISDHEANLEPEFLVKEWE
ncbi:MAG TPA: AraC family transcriptional regulator [Gammaproteobacteria bacterium]|nr:AraC family transcriptional regulator [Gammaproteobacteria bacterium]